MEDEGNVEFFFSRVLDCRRKVWMEMYRREGFVEKDNVSRDPCFEKDRFEFPIFLWTGGREGFVG